MKGVNSDVAYQFIREKILSGEFGPGATLTTSQLAESIGVSRTPVRDALRQLESDGLVLIRPHFGASVKSMNFQEFCEMCAIRLALESHAAGLAARHRSEADLQEITAAWEAMSGLASGDAGGNDARRRVQLVREDIRFHLAILAAAKNESMKKEILRLNLINRIVAGVGAAVPTLADKREIAADDSDVLAEHEAILSAVTQSNYAAARDAMEVHIQKIVEKQVRRARQARGATAGKELSAEELTYAT